MVALTAGPGCPRMRERLLLTIINFWKLSGWDEAEGENEGDWLLKCEAEGTTIPVFLGDG